MGGMKFLSAIALSVVVSAAHAQTPGTFSAGTPISSSAVNAALASKLDVSNPDTASAAGYQQNGLSALRLLSSSTNVQGLAAAPFACASLPQPITYGMVCLGTGALGMLANGGAETVAIGPFTLAEATGGFGATAVGEHVFGFDDPSYATGLGNDVARDAIGTGSSTLIGAQVMWDGQPTGPNTVLGALSLIGSAGTVKISGTKTTGDVLNVALSSTNSSAVTTGLPATASYTVLSGDTISTIANGIANAIRALGITYVSAAPAGAPSAAYTTPLGTNVRFDSLGNYYVALHIPGGDTTGAAITETTSCTGTCTETLTAVGPFSGTDNVLMGLKIFTNVGLTGAAANVFIGDYAAQTAAGAPVSNVGIGHQTMNHMTNDSWNSAVGSLAYYNATNLQYSVALGYKAGFQVGANAYDMTLLGAQVGSASALTGHDVALLGTSSQCNTPSTGTTNFFGICTGNGPILFGQSFGTVANSGITVTGDLISANSGTALATSATNGFIHMPYSAGAPTGVPAWTVGTYGPACEINTSTQSLNCYMGSSWYHLTMTSSAN